jgi:adenylate cyclase
MFTDMVGYTALGQKNEALALTIVDEQRKLIRPVLASHNGREVKTIGDALLVEFPSALDAARCAYDIQRAVREFNIPRQDDRKVHLRVGIHVGDVVESNGDISGDAVNVASRIQALAEDGGVCLTRQVYDHVGNKLGLPLTSLGKRALKNVSVELEVFKMDLPWQETKPESRVAHDTKRIAVLPFVSLTPDPNDSYFADSVTEEIISTLAGVSGLSVISRTSVMGYKGQSKKVKEIGQELEVGSVLEGSFRKAGNRIRVTTQLITVSDDAHVWARSYDKQLDDVFAVQSDIAKEVAEALRVKILSPELDRLDKKPTANTKAYTLYLKGRYYWNKRNPDDMKKAKECFEEAIAQDQTFALGYAGLADCHELLFANWGIDSEVNHEKAMRITGKALELDPDLAEAHATMGLVKSHDFSFREAEVHFRKAIELKPSYASAHQWYSLLLMGEERWKESLEQIEKAVELDPFSPIIHLNHAQHFHLRRDYGKAIELLKGALDLDPTSPMLHWALGAGYGKTNMIEQAAKEMETAIGLWKGPKQAAEKGTDALLAYDRGDKVQVKKLLPELEACVGDFMGPDAGDIAGYYFWLGNSEKGFAWLERAFSRREFFLMYAKSNPLFDIVRDDPRFSGFLERLGLKPEQKP